MDFLLPALISLPPLLIAVILHEIAHGWTAKKLGDPTAAKLGRITLNPIKHIDPVMTLLLPSLLILSGSPIIFGGAKPVPVNPLHFKNPRRDMVWVAVAGPVTNIVLAFISYGLFLVFAKTGLIHALPMLLSDLVIAWALTSILINIILALFNLFPIPPLDGGRIAVGLLPISLARPLARLEGVGILLVFGLLYMGVFDAYLGPVLQFFAWHIETIVSSWEVL